MHYCNDNVGRNLRVFKLSKSGIHKPDILEIKRPLPPVRGASDPFILSSPAIFASNALQNRVLSSSSKSFIDL